MNKKAYLAPATLVVNFDTTALLAGSPKITDVTGDSGITPGEGEVPGTADSRQAFSIWEE